MENPTKHPPRKGDLPREELIQRAEMVLKEYPPGAAEIHFKFTCQHCGERCTLSKANYLYENGECYKCGKDTPIKVGGFMVEINL